MPSQVSHASFEDSTFVIFLKSNSSIARYNTYKVVLSFTRIILNVASLAFVYYSISFGFWCPFSTTSHTSWEPRRDFIYILQLS